MKDRDQARDEGPDLETRWTRGCCLAGEMKTAETFVEKPKTVAVLREEIASGSVKAADLASSYYDRIAAVNPHLNVFLSLSRERAMAQADRVESWARAASAASPR